MVYEKRYVAAGPRFFIPVDLLNAEEEDLVDQLRADRLRHLRQNKCTTHDKLTSIPRQTNKHSVINRCKFQIS